MKLEELSDVDSQQELEDVDSQKKDTDPDKEHEMIFNIRLII